MARLLLALLVLFPLGCSSWETFAEAEGLVWDRRVTADSVAIRVTNTNPGPVLASLQGTVGDTRLAFSERVFLEPGSAEPLVAIATRQGWDAAWDFTAEPAPALPVSLQGAWIDSGLAGHFDGPLYAEAGEHRLTIGGRAATGIVSLQSRSEADGEVWGLMLTDGRHYLLRRVPQKHCANWFKVTRLTEEDRVKTIAYVTIRDPAGANAVFTPPLPRLPYGWWESLQAGDEAVFDVVEHSRTWGRTETTRRTLVEGRDGYELALYNDPYDPALPGRVNARAHFFHAPDASFERLHTETVRAADRSFPCTVYEVRLPGPDGVVEGRMWISDALPRCFNGGAVKSELRREGSDALTTVVLRSLTPRD